MSEGGKRMEPGERIHSVAVTRKAIEAPQELQNLALRSWLNYLDFRSAFPTASHWLLAKSERGTILDKMLSEAKDKKGGILDWQFSITLHSWQYGCLGPEGDRLDHTHSIAYKRRENWYISAYPIRTNWRNTPSTPIGSLLKQNHPLG